MLLNTALLSPHSDARILLGCDPDNPLAILASLLASCLVNPITFGKDAGVEAAGLLQPIDNGPEKVVLGPKLRGKPRDCMISLMFDNFQEPCLHWQVTAKLCMMRP